MPEPIIAPRVRRTFVQRIHAAPEQVFELLCPVREREWMPDWECRMIYSASGLAEPGAIFETAHEKGRTLWTIVAHEPARRVAFVRWQPDGLLVHIDILLGRHVDGETAACIAYTFTATDSAGARALEKLDEETWLKQMSYWEGSMNEWLRSQRELRRVGTA